MGKIICEEQATPSTPDTDKAAIYPKSDGKWYGIDDAGTETVLNTDAATVAAVVANASETVKGVVELLTDAEMVTGSDTTRAATAANMVAKMSAPGAIGDVTPGSGAFTTLTASSTLGVTGITTLSDDVKIAATKKLYLDGGTETYISESAADVMSLFAGGVEGIRITEAAAATTTDVTGTLALTKGSQDYHFTDRAITLALQSQSTGNSGAFEFFTKDGDGTDAINYKVYGVGVPTDITNRERLIVGWDGSANYEITTEADGTGTLRPLVLYTEGNANQLNLAVDGKIGVGIAPSNPFQVYHATTNIIAGFRSGDATALIVIADSAGSVGLGVAGTKDMVFYSGGGADDTGLTGATEAARIDASQRLLVGHTASVNFESSGAALQIHGSLAGTTKMGIARYSANTSPPSFTFAKSRHSSIGSQTIVQDGDLLGMVGFAGSDGVDFANVSVRLLAKVDDATPAANAIGGAFTISTATTAGVLTEAVRVDSSQNVGIGNSSLETWRSTTSVIQLGGNAVFESITSQGVGSSLNIGHNFYHDGTNYKFISADEATLLQTQAGFFNFFGTAAGLADGIISWTKYLTVGTSEVVVNEDSADIDFRVESDTVTNALFVEGSSGITSTANHYPITDNTYYLGKNDDDTPLAWKGLIVCDQTTGTYYRIEVDNGVLQATDLTD